MRSRLVGAFGIFVAVIMVVLVVIDAYFDRARDVESAFLRLENLATTADENLSARLHVIDLLLAEMAREIRRGDAEAAFLSVAKARMALLPGVRSVAIFDPAGKVVLSTLPGLKGLDVSRQPYFSQVMSAVDKSRTFLNGPLKAAATGATVVIVSRALDTTDDRQKGVIAVSLDPAYFDAILAAVRPDEGFAMLLGQDGAAFSPSNARAAGAPEYAVERADASAVLGQPHAEKNRVVSGTGDPQLVAYHTTDSGMLTIAVGLSQSRVLREWRGMSVIKIFAIVLLAVLTALILRRFAAHQREMLRQREFAMELVETANVIVLCFDAEGVVLAFNTAAEDVTGFPRSEILGRKWTDSAAFSGDAAYTFEALDLGALPRQFDGPIQTREKRARVISWRNTAIADSEIAWVSLGIDITDRLAAERQVAESRQFIQTIADNMPGLVAYWDAGLRCRFANGPYKDFFGRGAENVIGKTMASFIGERLLQVNKEQINKVLKGERQDFQRQLIDRHGNPYHSLACYIPDRDAEGAVIGFFVFVSDITSLKRAEIELMDTSKRLALAAKAGRFGVWHSDLGSRTLTWDSLMFQLYGLDPAAGMDYERWRSRLLPDDVAQVEHGLAEAREGRAEFDTEFRIVVGDGEIRHIKAAGAMEQAEDGTPVRMIGVNLDVTDIRENEIALVTAQMAAERANRTKSEFLANMSHEIRTPLNAILGLAYLLERTELNGEQQGFASKISVAGRSLLSIINDILDFSRVEAGRMELDFVEFALSDLLEAISTIVAVNAGTKDLELVISAAQGTPKMFVGDTLRLQQILVNLTSNAIKFTERGAVVLRAEYLGDAADGRAVLRFSVQDSGIGISAEALATLFNAFSQADSSTTRRYGGSGLGLAISKRLVELMGGEIGCESEVGRGSTFWFAVPLGVVAADKQLPRADAVRDLEILIADDHYVARDATAVAASALGWTPIAVASGREALEHARLRQAGGRPFDVMILDWKMPDMDGLATGHQLRGMPGFGDIPIVVMVTAHDREALMKEHGAEAIDAILVKPITGSSLYNAVVAARDARTGERHALVTAGAPPATGPRLSGARLLLAEDNLINQDVARRVLELEGASVVIVSDGRQAVDQLAAAPSAFDAVLMDVHMPVMDGYEATAYIRNTLGLKTFPVIALTAGALSTERNEAEQAGMDDFIAKPFDVTVMVNTIRLHVAIAAPAPAAVVPQLVASPGPDPISVVSTVAVRIASDPFGPPPPPTFAPLALPPAGFRDLSIPGIDIDQAFSRLGGDRELFCDLLARFEQQSLDLVPQVRLDLEAGKTKDAAHILHTLRGVSGNLAANAVMDLAAQAETAVRGGRLDDIGAVLDALEASLSSVVAAIRESDPMATARSDEDDAAAEELDRERLPALLAALDTGNINALSEFQALLPGLKKSLEPGLVGGIARMIENLDFDAAAQALRANVV